MDQEQPNPYESPRDPAEPPIFRPIEDLPVDEKLPLSGIVLRVAGVGCIVALLGTAAITWILRALLKGRHF